MSSGETRARLSREDDEEEAREAAWWRIAGTTAERKRLMNECLHGRPVEPIRKDVATFAQRQATAELGAWLPSALYTLGDVIDAALRPPSVAGAGEPAVTADQRLMAVAISCDEFKAELVTRVGQALASVLEADASAAVAKSDRLARLRGLL